MKIKKNSAQALILVLLILVVFAVITITIASLTARELEMREVDEMALNANYASESGEERAMYYLKDNTPVSQVTIREKCDVAPCNNSCPDSANCNANDCNCDLNPLSNKYYYQVTMTPNGIARPNGENCNLNYCIDSLAFSPTEL